MAKPVTLAPWATDPGTRLEPTAPEKAAGWSAGTRPPARYFNFIFGHIGDWIAYLNELHNDGDFLGQDYNWTANHVFDGTVEMADDVTIADDAEYASAKVRTVFLDLSRGVRNDPASTHFFSPAAGWQLTTDIASAPGDEVYLSLEEVPSGATITGISANIDNQGATSTAVVRFQRITPGVGGADNTVGTPADITNGVVTSTGVAENLALSALQTKSASRLQVSLRGGVGDGAVSRGLVKSVKVTYTEPRATGHF